MDLALKGLTSKLPAGWKPVRDNMNKIKYYYNSNTGKNYKNHPVDTMMRQELKERRMTLLFFGVGSLSLNTPMKSLKE